MTNQEILTKAIAKAKKNGWCGLDEFCHKSGINHNLYEIRRLPFCQRYKLLLTDHEFCRHLFGEKPTHRRTYGLFPYPEDYWENWQYHLRAMVITDNWLEYIELFLGEK